MKAMKAEFVQGTFVSNGVESPNSYAVHVNGKYLHIQESNVSFSKYSKAVQKNHPEYDFTEDVIIKTPAVEQAEHPYKEELSKAFDLDEVEFNKEQPTPVFNVDMETGEILENPQIININPLNNQTMENQVKNAPTSKVKVPFGTKVKWYSAKTAGIGVVTTTLVPHVLLQTAADALQTCANTVRNIEASAVTALKISDDSKSEIKKAIDRRTARIQSVIAKPVTGPVAYAKTVIVKAKEAKAEPVLATA